MPAQRGLIPRPVIFWAGVATCVAGVAEQFVTMIQAAPMHFRMAGMPMSGPMWAAMAAVAAGLVLAGCGLVPRTRPGAPPGAAPQTAGAAPAVRAAARRRLLGVLSFALVIDQLKPATLAFIEPGMRAEYHLGTAQIALLPLCALSGTVAGSLLWGHLADRIGRRAAVLLAAILFMGTTVCGAMPSFTGNLVMCVLMGMSAGGMLPIVYALMSEILPAGGGGILVLQAGLTTVAGYLAASGLAAIFLPLAGWRILWFVQLPLALALLASNRWIPESPGFLLAQGRAAEAAEVTGRFGIGAGPGREPRMPGDKSPGMRSYLSQAVLIGGYALSWGTIYWGFLTFLPSILGAAELGVSAPRLLFGTALLALPGTALAARLYSCWSSRKTMALYGLLTVVSLGLLAVVPLRHDPVWVAVALIGLLTGSSTVVAVIGPYAAHVYPTRFRGMGSGVAAACGKAGGLVGPPAVAWLLTALPFGAVAAVVAAPMAVAAGAIMLWGRETAQPRRPAAAPAGAQATVPRRSRSRAGLDAGRGLLTALRVDDSD